MSDDEINTDDDFELEDQDESDLSFDLEDNWNNLVPQVEQDDVIYKPLLSAQQFAAVDRVRELFEHFKVKRGFTLSEPFILKSNDISRIYRGILNNIKMLDQKLTLQFSASLYLSDDSWMNFSHPNDFKKWEEDSEAYAHQASLEFSYKYQPPNTNIPFVYYIQIDYSVTKDIMIGADTITAQIEYPFAAGIASLAGSVKANIKDTFMPFWWRWLRTGILKIQAFIFGLLITSGALFYLLMFFVLTHLSITNALLAEIISAPTAELKLNLLATHILLPGKVFFNWKFLANMIVSASVAFGTYMLFHKLVLIMAPPSIIALGKRGNRRLILIKVYSTIWIVVMSALFSAGIKLLFFK